MIAAPIYQTCGETDYNQLKVYLLSQKEDNISIFHSHLKLLGFPDSVFTIIKPRIVPGVGIDAKSGRFFYYNYDRIKHKDEDYIERLREITRNYMKDTLDFIRP